MKVSQKATAFGNGGELESGCFTIASLSLSLLSHLLTHPFAAGNFQIGPLYLPLMKVAAAEDERGSPPKKPKRELGQDWSENCQGFGGTSQR